MRQFGQWIVKEEWEGVKDDLSPSDQATYFEKVVMDKLNTFCPEKTLRLSSQDKPWVNSEIKQIDRQKSREWTKRGKTLKYQELAKKFKQKYEIEAEKYLNKNVTELMESKPGQAYSVLKRMGAQPGDCIDSNTFTLPSHERESLTDAQSAERIANY